MTKIELGQNSYKSKQYRARRVRTKLVKGENNTKKGELLFDIIVRS